MNKVVFLDRDGTINVDTHYLYKQEDFIFLPGVVESLKLLVDKGFLLIVITNQSGIARGYYTEDDFHKLDDWMVNKFKEVGVTISKTYYCPHLPNAAIKTYSQDCNCRKPKIGLFERAIEDFNIDCVHSFAIGDKLRDCAICYYTNCRGFLINTTELPDIINAVKEHRVRNVEYANTIAEAVNRILTYDKEG